MTNYQSELREQLAAIEHERWADWQKWCHKVLRENNPSPEQGDILERWDRQIETPYSELSDREKASDMEQVDRYWPLIQQYISKEVTTALEQHRQDCIKYDTCSVLESVRKQKEYLYNEGLAKVRATYTGEQE